MPAKFSCPNCGAPIEINDEQETTVCPFCNRPVQAPGEHVQQVQRIKLGKQARIWLIVILAVVLVPSCIGFGGTILGLLGGFVGTLVGILAPFLGN